jgi:hypothetical protein
LIDILVLFPQLSLDPSECRPGQSANKAKYGDKRLEEKTEVFDRDAFNVFD